MSAATVRIGADSKEPEQPELAEHDDPRYEDDRWDALVAIAESGTDRPRPDDPGADVDDEIRRGTFR